MTTTTPTQTKADAPAGNEVTRLNVNINSATAQVLRKIAEERGISFTEAVRRAFAVYSFVESEVQAGHKVQIVDEGTVREVVLV